MKRVLLYSLIVVIRIVSDLPLLWMFYFLYFPEQGSGGISAIFFNAGLFFSFATLHSLMARDFAKRFIARFVSEKFIRISYVMINGISLSLLLYLWQPTAGELWRTDGILYWFLSGLYASCIIGLIFTTFFIDYADFLGIRSLLRILKNRPSKPPVFSAKGPYAYCRHPMYLLLLISFWAGPVMTYGRLEFALLGSGYLFLGTLFEERNLRKELGNIYDYYRKNVPMWIPRIKPWSYS